MTRRRLALTLAGVLLAAALLPASAFAHGLAVRADLPIPESLFTGAAVIVLIVSFLALAALWPTPRLEPERWRPLPSAIGRAITHPIVEVLAGLVGVLLLVVVVLSGLFGVQSPQANFAPTFVYVTFWLGLVPISLVLGDVFRAFNPWRAIGRGVAWVAGKLARGGLPAPLPYPDRLGRLPAALGILAFAWLELVAESGDLPRSVAVATLLYSAATFLGMALYGVNAWTDRGEAFSVYFNLISRISPLERRDREIGVRKPLSGLPALNPLPGTVTLLMVMIGSVSFDGFSAGPAWQAIVRVLQGALTSLGVGPELALEITFGCGLIATILLLAGFYRLGIAGMRILEPDRSAVDLGRSFAHSLVPIAVVYAAAHYVSLLLTQGQAMLFLASDPLGSGWNLLGTAQATVNYGVIGANLTWYLQVGFVIAGHIAGLVLAHDRALVLYQRSRVAVQSQYWMLGVMLGFTVLALWLLSQANAG